SEEELSWKSSDDEEVSSQEEGNESNDDSDNGSDKESEETVKSGAGKSDEGVESIFTTTSSQSVSLVPPTPILTPSTIATITTSGEAPIPPPTIPSIIL
nr:hypothetical protein [Tanacetum cinerariifolium]